MYELHAVDEHDKEEWRIKAHAHTTQCTSKRSEATKIKLEYLPCWTANGRMHETIRGARACAPFLSTLHLWQIQRKRFDKFNKNFPSMASVREKNNSRQIEAIFGLSENSKRIHISYLCVCISIFSRCRHKTVINIQRSHKPIITMMNSRMNY